MLAVDLIPACLQQVCFLVLAAWDPVVVMFDAFDQSAGA